MASGHVLVSMSGQDYAKLVEVHGKKHTLFTANLPLIWKLCNGAGILRGSGQWKIVDSKLADFAGMLVIKRAELEAIVQKHVTYDTIKGMCQKLAKYGQIYPQSVSLCMASHPSDWLLALVTTIYTLSTDPATLKDIKHAEAIYKEIDRLTFPDIPVPAPAPSKPSSSPGRDSTPIPRRNKSPESPPLPKEPEEIKFYNLNERYGEFSNFAKDYPIMIDGKRWPTTEHYYQAQKFPGNPEYQDAIRAAPEPRDALVMGNARQNEMRKDWHKGTVKLDVMRTALRAKFTQHAILRKLLLDTGNAKLIEHTKNDKEWGDGGDGSGKNKLGFLLMEVREEMRQKSQKLKQVFV
jgi:ribA/ribD-fused uncharacterized protein